MMIVELRTNEYQRILPMLKGLENHPIINAVIIGTARGRIFVNECIQPKSALIWAFNEMFYLVGEADCKPFNDALPEWFDNMIIPSALEIGDDDLNLELYPFKTWEKTILSVFGNTLRRGIRVPFYFQENDYLQFSKTYLGSLPQSYLLKVINLELLSQDTDKRISNEILKFWPSMELFMEKGLGTCIVKDREIVGTCISAFSSHKVHEIGINTYGAEHRGKGLATKMAHEYIRICLRRGEFPRWTTESFRYDSIRIANKLGFKQLPNYEVFYRPFKEMRAIFRKNPILLENELAE